MSGNVRNHVNEKKSTFTLWNEECTYVFGSGFLVLVQMHTAVWVSL
jgi:hypothetical protein